MSLEKSCEETCHAMDNRFPARPKTAPNMSEDYTKDLGAAFREQEIISSPSSTIIQVFELLFWGWV